MSTEGNQSKPIHNYQVYIVSCFVFSVFYLLSFRTGLERFGFDQTIYQVAANQLNHGFKLYSEIWVSKSPYVYFFTWISRLFPYRMFELVLGNLSIFFIIKILRVLSISKLFQYLFVALFVLFFYFPTTYGLGNYSEEYGVFLQTLFIAFSILSVNKNSNTYLFLSGTTFFIAALTKEPLLIGLSPWILYLLLKRKNLFVFAGGLILSVILTFILLHLFGGFQEYLEYVKYSFAYSKFLNLSYAQKLTVGWTTILTFLPEPKWLFMALPIVGIVSIPHLPKRFRILGIIAACQFLLDITLCSISGYPFPHYYILLALSYTILAFIGVSSIASVIKKYTRNIVLSKFVMPATIVVFTTLALISHSKNFRKNLSSSNNLDAPIDLVAKSLPPNSTVYVDDVNLSRLYLLNGYHTTSYIPVPVFHFFMVGDPNFEKRVTTFRESLKVNPNEYIVTTETQSTLDVYEDLTSFLNNSYKVIKEIESPGGAIRVWKYDGEGGNN